MKNEKWLLSCSRSGLDMVLFLSLYGQMCSIFLHLPKQQLSSHLALSSRALETDVENRRIFLFGYRVRKNAGIK
uniref:Uncharacterized protein n=1 Tax=Anguilla anguilla TaxID=7936 RepID=A0A0E9T5X0_ANGAN